MNDSERLESIQGVLDELSEMSAGRILLVEGINDERALRKVGISGDYFHIQSEGGPVKAAEYCFCASKEAVVITDWDRKGTIIMSDVCSQLSALCVRFDISIHSRLRCLCTKYIKDVESLDSLIEKLASDTRDIKY